MHIYTDVVTGLHMLVSDVYVDAKPICRYYEPHPCNCKRPQDPNEKGCGDNCLNRLVYCLIFIRQIDTNCYGGTITQSLIQKAPNKTFFLEC